MGHLLLIGQRVGLHDSVRLCSPYVSPSISVFDDVDLGEQRREFSDEWVEHLHLLAPRAYAHGMSKSLVLVAVVALFAACTAEPTPDIQATVDAAEARLVWQELGSNG